MLVEEDKIGTLDVGLRFQVECGAGVYVALLLRRPLKCKEELLPWTYLDER